MNGLPAFLTMKVSTKYKFIIYFASIVTIRFVLIMFFKISDDFTAKIILKYLLIQEQYLISRNILHFIFYYNCISYLGTKNYCGGLNEIGPWRLIYFNAWYSLTGSKSLGVGFLGFKSPCHSLSFLLLSLPLPLLVVVV